MHGKVLRQEDYPLIAIYLSWSVFDVCVVCLRLMARASGIDFVGLWPISSGIPGDILHMVGGFHAVSSSSSDYRLFLVSGMARKFGKLLVELSRHGVFYSKDTPLMGANGNYDLRDGSDAAFWTA